jgi:hypothetical protein
MTQHVDKPAVLTDEDKVALNLKMQQLHQEGSVPFGGDGDRHAEFTDQGGNRYLVELKGDWVSKEELHRQYQEQKAQSE